MSRPTLLYYFVALEGIFSKFEINEEWVDYLIRNRTILLEWVRYNLIGYLQDRNPNVPRNCGKVQKPEKRDLRRECDYWKTIIEIDPKIKEIYQKVSLKINLHQSIILYRGNICHMMNYGI